MTAIRGVRAVGRGSNVVGSDCFGGAGDGLCRLVVAQSNRSKLHIGHRQRHLRSSVRDDNRRNFITIDHILLGGVLINTQRHRRVHRYGKGRGLRSRTRCAAVSVGGRDREMGNLLCCGIVHQRGSIDRAFPTHTKTRDNLIIP